MILYALIFKYSSGEVFGYVFEDLKRAREDFRDIHPFHPEAVIIEIPIKGLIL